MNPENLLFFCSSGKSAFLIDKDECGAYWEKSCPCACQMESGAEQEAHCNSEMKGKKHFSIEDTSSECFGISAVKVLCKSCRTLTEIVGGEDAGAVKSIGTFERTPLKCSSKKNWIQSNKRIHVLWKKCQKNKGKTIDQDTDKFQGCPFHLM